MWIGYDANGARRVWGETLEAVKEEARDYVKRRPETGPLALWVFEEE
jgi:hypothetical protein